MKDPYQVLGVSPSATAEELKGAYRRLAKKLHPDHNHDKADVAERFKEVSAAYGLLRDPSLKKRYDQGEINADGSEKAFAHSGFNRQGNPFRKADFLMTWKIGCQVLPNFLKVMPFLPV